MVAILTDFTHQTDPTINFVDMHHHSLYSDGSSSVEHLAKYFIKQKAGLALTDHNTIKGALKLAQYKNLFSIPALEVTSKETKDVLVYFYTLQDLVDFYAKIIRGRTRNNAGFNYHRTTIPVVELLDHVKRFNGVSILAHPFASRPKRASHLLLNKEFMKRIDAIESHNFANGAIKRTRKFVTTLDKPCIAGTDSHTTSPLNCLTGSRHFSRDDFLESIVKNKNILFHKPGGFFKKVHEHFTILKNNFHIVAPSCHD